MTRSRTHPILTALLLALCGGAAAAELPPRKPGLWEMKIETGGGAPPVTARHCVDAATDAAMQRAGRGAMGGECTQEQWTRDGQNLRGESVCKLGGTTLTSRSVITGDFDSAFRMDIDARYDPPMMGRSQSRTTVAWRWSGACPAGWKPGEMEMPGTGQRINVLEAMSAGAPPKRK